STNIIRVDIDESLLNEKTRDRMKKNLQKKLDKKDAPKPDFKGPEGLIFSVKRPRPGSYKTVSSVAVSSQPVSGSLRSASQSLVKEIEEFANVNHGGYIYKPVESINRFSGSLGVAVKPRDEEKIRPKILFYERFQLSNFLGNYGAGRVIKTFSLF